MDKIFAAFTSWQSSITLSGDVYVDEKHLAAAHSEAETGAGREEMPRPLEEPVVRGRGLGPRKEGNGDGRGKGQIELGEGARRLQKPHKTRVDFDPRPRLLALRADREAEAGGPGREGDLQIRLPERLGSDKRLLLEHGGFRPAPQGHEQAQASDWMNLFAFKFGCPGNALQKAEKLLDLLLKCKEIVRYRD